MIAKEPGDSSPSQLARKQRWWPWVSTTLFTLILIGVGGWYLNTAVNITGIKQALVQANGRYIILGLIVMITNGALKAWRWGILLQPANSRPAYATLFWSVWLGQYVNMAVPFLRLGEIARTYALNQQTGLSKIQTITTLVVEKTLDMFMLGLTLLILIPFLILPEFVGQSVVVVGLLALAAILSLYFLAYKTERIIQLLRVFGNRLPDSISDRFVSVMISGLQGLASLRHQRMALVLLGSSGLIAILSILTPFVLFPAVDIEQGIAAAALIDSALSLTTTPPSTPGQLGIFEGTVVLVLSKLGTDDAATIISYAIIYHLVVLLPKIILGSIAASRTGWRWRRSVP